jgi:predicted amidophosphoribosyltransferase
MSLLVECPNCGQNCAYDATTCPNCGQRWPNKLLKQQRIKRTLLYIALFVAFVVASFVGFLVNKMKIANTMSIGRVLVHRIIHADKLEDAIQ